MHVSIVKWRNIVPLVRAQMVSAPRCVRQLLGQSWMSAQVATHKNIVDGIVNYNGLLDVLLAIATLSGLFLIWFNKDMCAFVAMPQPL